MNQHGWDSSVYVGTNLPNQARPGSDTGSDFESENEIDLYGCAHLNSAPGQVDKSMEQMSYWEGLSGVSPKADQAITKSPHALAKHEEGPMPSTYFNDPISSATDGRGVNLFMSNTLESPHDRITMGDVLAMSCWGLKAQTSNQSYPTVPAPSPSKDAPIIAVGYPGLNHDTISPFSQLDEFRSPVDPMHYGQGALSSIACEQSSHTGNKGGSAHSIGHVLDNGKFMCDDEECDSLTFARVAELRRHHATIHATEKPNFWCQIPSCRRSMNGGDKPFHRKDKLLSHIRNMHPDVH